MRIDGLGGHTGDFVEAAVAHEQVVFATALTRSRRVVTDNEGVHHDVALAAADPKGLRRLMPEVTAETTALWQRLVEGDAVVSYQAAERLGVELGDRLTVSGSDHPPLRVGALADTGEPPVADVLVSAATAQALDMPEPNALLAATTTDTPATQAAVTLQEDLGGRAVALVDESDIQSSAPGTVVDLPNHVWERLAQCESSGRWHINTGNGYYGGLQFLPETWWWLGGTGLPHEASRAEQIRRAEMLLSVQGWDAWPACSKELRLRQTVGTVR